MTITQGSLPPWWGGRETLMSNRIRLYFPCPVILHPIGPVSTEGMDDAQSHTAQSQAARALSWEEVDVGFTPSVTCGLELSHSFETTQTTRLLRKR